MKTNSRSEIKINSDSDESSLEKCAIGSYLNVFSTEDLEMMVINSLYNLSDPISLIRIFRIKF